MPTDKFQVEGVQETVDAIRSVWQAYREGLPITEDMTKAMREQADAAKESIETYRMMGMNTREYQYEMKENLRVFREVGSVGREMVSMWQAYTVAQIRVERISRDVADAQEEVSKWQELVNQYLRDFGEDSSQYLDACQNLENAQDDLRTAQENLYRAYTENVIGYAGIALDVGALAAEIATLTAVTGSFPVGTLATLLGYLSNPIVAGGIVLTAQAIKDLSENWDQIIDTLQRGKPILEWTSEDWAKNLYEGTIGGLPYMPEYEQMKNWWETLQQSMIPLREAEEPYGGVPGYMLPPSTRGAIEETQEVAESIETPIAPAMEYRLPAESPWVLGGFPTGGIVPFTGEYFLHAGERVERERVTSEIIRMPSKPELQPITVNVYGTVHREDLNKIIHEIKKEVRKLNELNQWLENKA